MYIVFGDEVLGSQDVKDLIEKNSDFKIETDLTKSSKREDIIAFKMWINVSDLNLNIVKETSIEDKINAYMEKSDQLGENLAPKLHRDAMYMVYSYNFDEVENRVYSLFVLCHEDLGDLKLNDVLNRYLRQV